MRMFKKPICLLALPLMVTSCFGGENPSTFISDEVTPVISFDFDSHNGDYITNKVNGVAYKIDHIYSETNANKIFKAPSDPLFKTGVGSSGSSLYMDGFSTKMVLKDVKRPKKEFSASVWVAPRGFENLAGYGPGLSEWKPRLSSILNQGDIEAGEGFCLGYGRLGEWGIQLCVEDSDTSEQKSLEFYDPLHKLPLYEWSHVAVSYNGVNGYLCLYFNGQVAYEAYLPELENTELIYTAERMILGHYCNPQIEKGCPRQYPSGLIDGFKYYNKSVSPKQFKKDYESGFRNKAHPILDYEDIKEDRAQYEGDRYRPIYHGIGAVWMNEPHAPIYYKGRYHLFYQHDPIGPYWSQIRWGHWVSDDMIHWSTVKDAVAPTEGICPEGVWTGGSVIGPDGTPWLIITAGTNLYGNGSWSGQNVAYAHCVDPDDPDLTDWVVESTQALTQLPNDVMGEREQFRDPFVWYDDGLYYMLVSTSIPGKGGSANVFTSPNMRDWEYHGYLYECNFEEHPIQGAHWECVVMFPISSKDGKTKKWILFDCPQYTYEATVDCLYWIGNFDKKTCRFTPDREFGDEPRLFDLGSGFYTGQTGFCYLTDEDRANGKTRYEDGRTVIIALAQGKSAGTEQNLWSGWAHNLAMPVDVYLADDGVTVIREPIKELESALDETVYTGGNEYQTIDVVNEAIKDVRGDTLEIKFNAQFEDEIVDPNTNAYDLNAGLYVRYNKNTVLGNTERTAIRFTKDDIYIDRSLSSLLSTVQRYDSNRYPTHEREFEVTMLLDRSLLEVYINGIVQFTTRIYPKYGNSDYLKFFEDKGSMKVSNLSIERFGSVYFDETTPAYYTEDLGE